jgi:ankyrin repeat protein
MKKILKSLLCGMMFFVVMPCLASEEKKIDSLFDVLYLAKTEEEQNKQIQDVEILLKNGADVNEQRKDDKTTPLHYVATASRYYLIPVLIKYGANLSLKDKNGMTAQDIAKNKKLEKEFLEAVSRGQKEMEHQKEKENGKKPGQ